MRVAFFDKHEYEEAYFDEANKEYGHEIEYFKIHLNHKTAELTAGFDAVCAFVNDCVDQQVLETLAGNGVKVVALRSAGFNNVDLKSAHELGLKVVRVPEYSPYAVAEFGLGLMLNLNRKIHRAYSRVREMNFTLDGLVGFDFHDKTVGIIGTGRIGHVMAKIMSGLGCRIVAYDKTRNEDLLKEQNVTYCDNLNDLYKQSDIITLHVPLNPHTHHLIDADAIAHMKEGVMLINTGRGALIDTRALIDGLKRGKIGSAGLDVYEEEEEYFFQNLSDKVVQDDLLARLLTFPNVIVTSHQGFLTREALTKIAHTTLQNLKDFSDEKPLVNEVAYEANA